MINNLENENIVLEVRALVKNIDDAKDNLNIYCELVKQMFLSNSGKN